MKKIGILSVTLIMALIVGISIFAYHTVKAKNNLSSNISSSAVSAKKDDGTHIFMCADDGNAMPTCVTIASVLSNSLKDEKVNIHIVSFDDNHMSTENINKIEKLKETIKDFNLDFTYFDKNRLNNLDTERWNKAILIKLFAQELFPKLERIIWLDDDIIVLKSLNEMFIKDFGSKCIAGVEVSDEYRKHHERDVPYWITAGFGVYNLKEMRKQNTQKILLDGAKSYRVGSYDQGECCGAIEEYALTSVPKEQMLILPYKYSVMCTAFGKDAYKDLRIEDCVVLHFAGIPKPWNEQSHIAKKFADEWNKYYNLTQYAKETHIKAA